MNISDHPRIQFKNNFYSGQKRIADSKCSFHKSVAFMGRLDFSPADFFVNIHGYGQNFEWARNLVLVANNAVSSISSKLPAETVLIGIADGVHKCNRLTCDADKIINSGLLRIRRSGWSCVDSAPELLTRYSGQGVGRYRVYSKKLDQRILNPLHCPFFNFGMTTVNMRDNVKFLKHGGVLYVNRALEMTYQRYNKLLTQFPEFKVGRDNLENFCSTVAEIRWILAHSTPWVRGSDAIANVFIRSLFKAFGIKLYPLKKNVSLDLEAYCTELKDYKENFHNYFVKPPEIL